jgi:putative component of membrane protein insertase Oxa1/YidC/SpoIIIJ protein YidD
MAATRAIGAYQATLSPDHGPLKAIYSYGYCRHHPTCSQYAKLVYAEKGFLHGTWLTFRRLLTCHPWNEPSPERVLQATK